MANTELKARCIWSYLPLCL